MSVKSTWAIRTLEIFAPDRCTWFALKCTREFDWSIWELGKGTAWASYWRSRGRPGMHTSMSTHLGRAGSCYWRFWCMVHSNDFMSKEDRWEHFRSEKVIETRLLLIWSNSGGHALLESPQRPLFVNWVNFLKLKPCLVKWDQNRPPH